MGVEFWIKERLQSGKAIKDCVNECGGLVEAKKRVRVRVVMFIIYSN